MKTAITFLNIAIATAFTIASIVVGIQLVRAAVDYYFGLRQ